jgi:hypothetical protein
VGRSWQIPEFLFQGLDSGLNAMVSSPQNTRSVPLPIWR